MKIVKLNLVLCFLGVFSLVSTAFAKDDKVLVLTSVRPIAFLMSQVCQGFCEARAVIPYGVSEHDWEPSPKEVIGFTAAKLAVGVGLGFDERIFKKITAAAPGLKVNYVGKDVKPLKMESHDDHDDHHHDHASGEDPHIWFDPFRMAIAATKMGEVLSAEIPKFKTEITANALKVKNELEAFGKETLTKREAWTKRPVLVFHDSLGYLAEAFKLHVEPIVQGSSGREISAKNFAKMVKNAKKERYAGIIVEQEDGLSKNLGRELKIPVVKLDFSSKSDQTTYQEWLWSVLKVWPEFER